MCVCVFTCIYMYIQINNCIHRHTYIRVYTYKYTYTCVNTHTYTHADRLVYMFIYVLANYATYIEHMYTIRSWNSL